MGRGRRRPGPVLGTAAGSAGLELQHVTVQPFGLSSLHHCHACEEELFVVLAGDGSCLLGHDDYPVRRGSVLARPAGTNRPHAFRAGETGLVLLAVGERNFEELNLRERSADKGAALKARLEGLMTEQTLIGEVRGRGLMVGVELVEDRTTKKPASAAARFVRQYCLDHGVLIGVGGNFASVLRVQPPLVISQLRLDNVSVTIVDGLEAAKKAGVAG